MTISDTIRQYTKHDSVYIRNRANIILQTLEGQDSNTIAENLGLSLNTVKKWQNAWEKDAINIFPAMEDNQPLESSESSEASNGNHSQDNASEVMLMETTEDAETQVAEDEWVFPEIPAIRARDSMAEAGRIIMLQQLQVMLEQEAIARQGEDIEGVHQMRVASRRWRSAYDTFGDYLPKAYKRGIQKGLKRTAKRLGKVRDLDVFLLKTRAYIESENAELQSVLRIVEKDHRKAQKRLSQGFDKKQYQQFIERAFQLLTEPVISETLVMKSGELSSTRLDHVLPVMLYQRFEAVRRYEDLLENAPIETLHSLRKDCKRLRYILEMFSDILGAEVKTVIQATKQIQDHLGDMYDAQVATHIIRAAEKHVPKADRSALKAYRKYRKTEITHLRDSFPEVWSVFNQAEIRYALAQAVAVL